MQFQVPQFIETEDKIIGPLTLKQFAYVGGGGLILFLLYFIFEFWLWLIIGGAIGLLVVLLAFLRYNNRPFIVLLFALINYFWQPRLYLWRSVSAGANRETVSGGGLSILGLKLDTFIRPLSERREKSLRPSFLDRWRTAKERFEIFRKITGEREAARRVDYR